MNCTDKVAVCSRSFSRNPLLREELLSCYKHVTFNDEGISLSGSSLINFLRGHTKAIIALEVIDDNILDHLPDLKVIGKYGVGLDMIDMDSLSSHGVGLGWTGGVNRRSVSELVIAFCVLLLRHLPQANKDVLSGNWRQHVGSLLSYKKVGIIGCGNIGQDLIKLLSPWGCSFVVNDIINYSDFYRQYSVIPLQLDELLSSSDIISLHVPLNANTYHILNAKNMRHIQKHAILINTARGGLVDEITLFDMLSNNELAAAAFDVLENEPPDHHPLFDLSNFWVTPHLGGSSKEVILDMGRAAINGLDNYKIPNLA